MVRNMAFAKRGRVEIIYDILCLCQRPAQKTHILFKCNLSFNQLQKYLKYLVSHDLISSYNGAQRELYKTTDKGKKFIEGYESLANHLVDRTRYMLGRTLVRG